MSQVAEVFEINRISEEECWYSSIQELPCHRVYNNYTPARRAPALQTRAVALQRQPPAGEEEDMRVSLVFSRALVQRRQNWTGGKREVRKKMHAILYYNIILCHTYLFNVYICIIYSFSPDIVTLARLFFAFKGNSDKPAHFPRPDYSLQTWPLLWAVIGQLTRQFFWP